MSESLRHVVNALRSSGLRKLADEAQQTLPDPVRREELERFAADHHLSAEILTERMGGSP